MQRTAVALKSQASAGVGELQRPGDPHPPGDGLVLVTVHSASASCATEEARPPRESLPPHSPRPRLRAAPIWPRASQGRQPAGTGPAVPGASNPQRHRPGVTSGRGVPQGARSAAWGAASSVNLSPREETGTTVAAASTSQQTTLVVGRLLRQTRWRRREQPLVYRPRDQSSCGRANECGRRASPLGPTVCVTGGGAPGRRARGRSRGPRPAIRSGRGECSQRDGCQCALRLHFARLLRHRAAPRRSLPSPPVHRVLAAWTSPSLLGPGLLW